MPRLIEQNQFEFKILIKKIIKYPFEILLGCYLFSLTNPSYTDNLWQ